MLRKFETLLAGFAGQSVPFGISPDPSSVSTAEKKFHARGSKKIITKIDISAANTFTSECCRIMAIVVAMISAVPIRLPENHNVNGEPDMLLVSPSATLHQKGIVIAARKMNHKATWTS
jgi:hypothetical protein